MTVENTAAGVGHRLVVVVAFDQHGEETGDAARPDHTRPGPFQETRQAGEDRRRVALAGRRFAGREADLAQSHGEAGD
jgi:hypothetical protein